MRRYLFGNVVAVLATVLVACNPFDTNRTIILDVTNLDAPATIAPGTSLTVTLTVTTGGCKTFDRIVAQRFADGALLAAFGQNASGGACTADIRNELHSLTLDPPFQSPFTIQVDAGTLPPLTATVLVQ